MRNKSMILTVFMAMVAFVGMSYSAPRDSMFVTKTSRNEGDSRKDIAVAVSSTAWTTVLYVSTRRRDAVLHTHSSASYDMCLSSATTTEPSCVSATRGIHLEPGGTYTDYNEGVLKGRLEDGASGSQYIYGQEHYDSKDSSTEQ